MGWSVCVYCASVEGIDPRHTALAAAVGRGFVRPEALTHLKITTEVAEALDSCANGTSAQ